MRALAGKNCAVKRRKSPRFQAGGTNLPSLQCIHGLGATNHWMVLDGFKEICTALVNLIGPFRTYD
jgi:hypothetical protein